MKREKKAHGTANESAIVNRKRLLNDDTPFAIREAYVKLRTNMMFCMTADRSRPCKTFAVTSCKPHEGKSLNSANIAISFAMLGKKVILIDADMRMPTQHRLWKLGNSNGLCDHLVKRSKIELAKVRDLPLGIVGSGTIPPNPSELLSSERMMRFVEECADVSDYVIIDTPPINTVADAQIISTFVDGIVLVTRSGQTTSRELTSAIDTVRRASGNLCGVVLNDLNVKSAKSAYKYKYGEEYGYGYGYSYSSTHDGE